MGFTIKAQTSRAGTNSSTSAYLKVQTRDDKNHWDAVLPRMIV